MVLTRAVSRAVLLLFSAIYAISVAAQPTLPDIAVMTDEGNVVLSWTCPYKNIKGTSVFRSADSTKNFSLIGYADKLSNSIQSYRDEHALRGQNCYNVVVGFKSGLTWRSNTRCIVSEKYSRESEMLLQKKDAVNAATQPEKPSQPSNNIRLPAHHNDSVELPSNIRSKSIYVDGVSGHVNISLPTDVATHQYSVKFYDRQNHEVTEVPEIYSQHILLDKRTFQRDGVYKFELRRDGTDFETGYIEVSNL